MGDKFKLERETSETKVYVEVDLQGTGLFDGDTDSSLFEHFLRQISTHGMIDLGVWVEDKLEPVAGFHHVVEDVAICLGQTLNTALGDRRGIRRFGEAKVPMDGCLVAVTLDLVERPYCDLGDGWEDRQGPPYPSLPVRLLTRHFFHTLAMNGRFTMHVELLRSDGDEHHLIEVAYKAFGLALRRALETDPRREGFASSKGVM